MNLYEMLKARIVGYSNDFLINIYAQKFAQPAATWHEYTGTLPYTITSDGTAATINIKGNTVQDGTPTPSNPVDVQGVGTLDSGEYKIPISNGQQTTNIYLGSVTSNRNIAKYVFDGTDNLTWTKSGTRNYSWFFNQFYLPGQGKKSTPFLCSHGATATTLSEFQYGTVYADNTYNLGIFPAELSTVTDLRQWLATQYANGTPVTIWYVLATPETGTVNEPLMKIGNYTDSISGISLPTTSGSNTISASTTVQPSEVYIKWKG